MFFIVEKIYSHDAQDEKVNVGTIGVAHSIAEVR